MSRVKILAMVTAFLFLTLSILFLAEANAKGPRAKNPPPSAPVPQTGQTVTYSPGDDGDLQMGVPWPDPRFTDKGDGTVRDNLTGLIWLKNANCFGLKTWQTALDSCNNLKHGDCGLTDFSVIGDWRLPNRKELESLLDFGREGPSLPLGPPFVNGGIKYWTSTGMPGGAWFLDANGVMDATLTSVGWSVWPVRDAK